MTKITKFDKTNIKDVRVKIDEALALLKEVGIIAKIGNIRYNETSVSTKLEFSLENPVLPEIKMGVARIVPNNEKHESFNPFADKNLPPKILFEKYQGSKCLINGKFEVFTHIEERNRKYPFIVGDYKLSKEQFLDCLR